MILRRFRQAGFGTLLTLVLVLLLVLAIIGLGHGTFSSSVSNMSKVAARSDMASDLANNGLTESHFYIANSVNDPASFLYDKFRSEKGDFSFSLTATHLNHFFAELKEQTTFQLEGSSVEVKVSQAPLSKARPTEQERLGSLSIFVTIKHSQLDLTRRLVSTFEWKLVKAGPPRPLDDRTLFIAKANPLVKWGLEANDSMDKSIKRLGELLGLVQRARKAFEDMKNQVEGQSGASSFVAQLNEAIQTCQKLENEWPKIEVKTGDTKAQTNALHHFPTKDFSIESREKEIDLDKFNLPHRVRERALGIEVKEQEQGAAWNAYVKAFQDQNKEGMKLFKEWVTKVTALAAEYKGLLIDDYKDWQDTFSEVTGSERTSLLPAISSMAIKDVVRQVSAGIFEGDAHGNGDLRPLQEKFDDLLARGNGHSGVIFVNNPKTEFQIDRTFKGRLTIVVKGDVVVKRALVEDVSCDTITIISYGRMTVEGNVAGTLIAGRSLIMDDGVKIDGTLIVLEPDYLTIPANKVFTGKLMRDERLMAGPQTDDGTMSTVKKEALYVVVAPVQSTVEMYRQ